jgi:hypothetical protein
MAELILAIQHVFVGSPADRRLQEEALLRQRLDLRPDRDMLWSMFGTRNML